MANIRKRIELWFESLARTLFRNRLKTLLVMLVFVAALLSQLPKITIDISTEGFLHKDDQALIDYNVFRDQFGEDELIVVAISSPDIFDQRFLKKLKAFHDDLEADVPHLDDITSLVNARNTRGEEDELIVEDLLENWPETPEAIADLKRRVLDNPLYVNMLISADGKFTTVIIKPNTYSLAESDLDVLDGFDDSVDEDLMERESTSESRYLTDKENSEVVNAVRKVIKRYNREDFKTYIAGSSVVTHFIKVTMIKDVKRFLIIALGVIALLLFIMFRKISGVILPLVVVVLSLLSTIAIMAATGASIKLPTQILPSFLLAVSVGDSVHILAMFYQHLRKNGNKEDSVVYAVGHSGLAVFMTSITTAAGLISFSTSDVAPIADLGVYAAVGVMLALVYTIVLLPALLAVFPVKIKKSSGTDTQHTPVDKMLARVGEIATGYPYRILIVSAGIIALSIFGATKIHFSHDVLKWLPENNFARIATETIDQKLRGTVNLEMIIDTGKENGLYNPDILNRLEETAAFLENLQVGEVFVGKAWSLTTILKEINRALHENRKEFYTIPKDKNLIAQELLLFENSGSDDLEDFTDSQFSKARFMIKVPFKDAVTYSSFIDIVSEHFQEKYPAAEITTTGMLALFFRTVSNAIASMAKSYTYALVVITILMILLIGHLRIGLLSMVPNLTPIIAMLGIMGWFNIPMSLFTMLVGNIAIGLAVDDTVHFMHNFRRYFEETKDAKLAVMETLDTAGRAMLVTTCVLAAGFFIFMLADMNNLVHFGLLTGLTIIMALLADYFIAPALLVVVYHRKTEQIDGEEL